MTQITQESWDGMLTLAALLALTAGYVQLARRQHQQEQRWRQLGEQLDTLITAAIHNTNQPD